MTTMPGVQLKCKICGDVKFKREGNREVCEYCGATYVLSDPGMESELRTAESFREGAQFDPAESLYRKVIDRYAEYDLSDAYWGLFLCEQRVLFETDAQGERFPSFFSISPQCAEDSAFYKKAIGAASVTDAEKADVYRKLCKKIAAAKELYRKIGSSSKPFDIFICFKKSLMSGEGYTKDWKMAYDLYDRLSPKYNVFFSEKTLNNVVVHQYEPNIYYGLYTAKVMLLLCSKTEYLESQWVKNEWSRFYAFGQNPATGKTIIPIFIDDFTPDRLPIKLQSYQGYPADYNLLDHLNKNLQAILNPEDKNAEVKAMEARLAEQQAAFERKQASYEKQMADLRREIETKKEEPKGTWNESNRTSFSAASDSLQSKRSSFATSTNSNVAKAAAQPKKEQPPTASTPPRSTVAVPPVPDLQSIKKRVKEDDKFKRMLFLGIVCLFFCFWVGVVLLVSRVAMINKAANAEYERLMTERNNAIKSNGREPSGSYRSR